VKRHIGFYLQGEFRGWLEKICRGREMEHTRCKGKMFKEKGVIEDKIKLIAFIPVIIDIGKVYVKKNCTI
jgi:hypothetical protein